jgi:hypothetical protein
MAVATPEAGYFDLIVQIREHGDAFEAEYQRFSDRVAALIKEGKPVPPALMALWARRIAFWLAIAEAYRPAAARFAQSGETGLLACLTELTGWMQSVMPDDEDKGPPRGEGDGR